MYLWIKWIMERCYPHLRWYFLPFKKTSFFPLYVEYVDEIFNPHLHLHILHMRIIRIFRIFRIFRIRMASPNDNDTDD